MAGTIRIPISRSHGQVSDIWVPDGTAGAGTGQIPAFSIVTRPSAAVMGAYFVIFNTTTFELNTSDGVHWYDALGNLA